MSYIKTLKELKLLTANLTDFSSINLLHIDNQFIKYLPQEQKNAWFVSLGVSRGNNKLMDFNEVQYTNRDGDVTLTCLIHNKKYTQIASYFLSGRNGCGDCVKKSLSVSSSYTNRNRSKEISDKIKGSIRTLQGGNIDETIKKSLKFHDLGEYEYFDDYVNDKTKIKIKHIVCGKPFWQTPNNHSRGKGCPYCASSKGEKAVSKILIKNNITLHSQHHFNKHAQLKGKGTSYMTFDFYLPDYNLCVEYDGEHHYKEIKHFKLSLEQVQQNDLLKNQFCLDNNIRLLRIPYWVNPTDILVLSYLNEDFTVINVV